MENLIPTLKSVSEVIEEFQSGTLVAAILLRVAGLDALDGDAQA